MDTDGRKWIQGMFLVLAVALIWIVASYVVQSVEEDGLAPFVLTYICNSLFIILIPLVEGPRLLRRWFGTSKLQGAPSSEENSVRDGKKMRKSDSLVDMLKSLAERTPSLNQWLSSSPSSSNLEEGALLHINEDERGSFGSSVSGGGYTRARMMLMALTICPFWFAAQFTFNWSLSKTSVSSNTILSSTSSIFTFLLSLTFLGERFTVVKLVSVFLCLAGTAVVALADKKTHPDGGYDTIYGDILCLLSAAFYGIYTSLIRGLSPMEGGKAELVDAAKVAGEESGVAETAASSVSGSSNSEGFSTALLFGYIGVFNLLLLFPVGVLIQMSKLENLTLPTLHQWGLVIGKGLFDNVLSDYLWARAVLLTTTTAATTGLQIQVPIAIAVDSISAGQWPDWMHLSGAFLVLAGFVGINSNFLLASKWFGHKTTTIENKATEAAMSNRL